MFNPLTSCSILVILEYPQHSIESIYSHLQVLSVLRDIPRPVAMPFLGMSFLLMFLTHCRMICDFTKVSLYPITYSLVNFWGTENRIENNRFL